MLVIYRLEVYNLWGQWVYAGYNPDEDWNCTDKGKPADIVAKLKAINRKMLKSFN